MQAKVEQRNFWLDLVRGLSAMAVFSGHLRAALFVDYSHLSKPSFLWSMFYSATSFWHQAVMVFFVLSGFPVGASVLKKENSFIWYNYTLARLSRLWVALIPALIVTFFVDVAIGILSPEVLKGDYLGIWSSGPRVNEYSASVSTFIGNLFFLQGILTPTFGTNGPHWSLANEFWYYVLFPLCAYASGKCYSSIQPKISRRLMVATLAVAIFVFLPFGIRFGYFIWLLGVVVFVVIKRFRISNIVITGLGAVSFLAALGYSKSTTLQSLLHISSDLLVGLGFTFCLHGLAQIPFTIASSGSFITRIVKGLSAVSYSLYVFHFPFVVLIAGTIYGKEQLQPDIKSFAEYAVWLVCVFILCVGFWWLFERRTQDVKKYFEKFLKTN